MKQHDAAKTFREKAELYLDMIPHVRCERRRRILHELFEENEAKADALDLLRRNAQSKTGLRSTRLN